MSPLLHEASGHGIRSVVELVDGLQKVYKDKNPSIRVDVAAGAAFRGDTGDFLELAGNLVDNACKFDTSGGRIDVVVDAGSLTVLDRGAGIEPGETAADGGVRPYST